MTSKIGAFFDMDYTLLAGSSGLLYLRWLRQTGQLTARQWAGIMRLVGQYTFGRIDFPRMLARLLLQVAGASEDEAWRMTGEWFNASLKNYIADKARERVAWHQAQGHQVAIISAATPYVVRHVAGVLGLDGAYLATRLEVVEGRFTGNVVEPACYGAGKRILAEVYAFEHGIDLGQSYFYSDSHQDLPLLLAVGHPVAVNPNRKLARIAQERGWPVVSFYRMRSTLIDRAR